MFTAGCSADRAKNETRPASAYISAILDPAYAPTPQSRVLVYMGENAEIEARKLRAILLSQMVTDSFNVVTSNADFSILLTTQEVRWSNTVLRTRKIWLNAYATRDLDSGHEKTAWEGYIAANALTFDEDPAAVVRTLLHYFGKDFKGAAPIIR